jgi:hypothetical protein
MLRKYQVLTAIDKCISVTPHINIQMLENIHEMVCESKITYGIEVWGLSDVWKEKDKFHSRFCKKSMGTPNCAANGLAQMELGRENKEVQETDCKILVIGLCVWI